MYRLAPSVARGLLCVLAMSMLVACSAADTGTLTPQDAARWLYQTCAVTFARDPQVLKGAALKPTPRQSWSVFVSGTVVLPDAEVRAALESLRGNRSLHKRGHSETRYSYESFPGVLPEKECELDTSLHVLYFRYTE